nr:hypothetical protein [uncultured Enterococcus sp.]
MFEEVAYDFFAVSMPETVVFKNDLTKNNQVYCRYLIALGNIGLKENEKAEKLLKEILLEVPDYQGAIRHLAMVQQEG